MLYLILAIVSSALISVLMRVSEKYSRNRLSLLAMNYLMCSAMAVITMGPQLNVSTGEGVGPLFTSIGLGCVSGVLYLASFMLLQWNISKNGVVLPSTFMKLGVLVPTVMAVFVFGEALKISQILGIAAALCAIFMIQGGGKSDTGSIAGLIVLLLVGGITDSMSKIYEEIGPADLKDLYLLCTFGVALLLCTILCIVKKQKLTAMDALFGLIIGIPNYLSSRFLLLSLSEVSAVVAYPSFSVGTIVLVTLAGVLLFKENLSKRKIVALGTILAALALLNL